MIKKVTQLSTYIIGALTLGAFFVMPLFAQDFTQGYATDDTLLRSAVVSSHETDADKVEGATLDNIDRLFGIVVKSDESPLTITSDTAGAFVATSGKFEVLVSNLNGPVYAGNYITSSSLKGVAMLADPRQSHIVGRALQDLDFTQPEVLLGSEEVTAQDGTVFKAGIGRILVDVNVEENPLGKNALQRAPGILASVGESIAGKEVNIARIYAAIAILLISFGVGGSILYASIRSSIISIGRNPLSKGRVLKGFSRVAFVAIAIFIMGFFAVYLILTI